MRTTVWDLVVTALIAVVVATAFAVREASAAALPVGVMWGVLAGALFSTFVRLLQTPLQREVDALRDKVAELERRSSGTGSTAT